MRDDRRLNQLKQLLLSNTYRVKVGILGEKNQRAQGKGDEPGTTNAEIGVKHEFGMEGLPVRSFLRMPLKTHLAGNLYKAGFNADTVRKIIDEKSLVSLFKKIGLVAERTVDDAFKTRGFGRWKPSNMAEKKVHQTLIETSQLRRSITSKVEKS
jgi:hypothetical protein